MASDNSSSPGVELDNATGARHFATPFVHGSTALAALRKAALLAHWVPGIGALVAQHEAPPLGVAVADVQQHCSAVLLHPCEFRKVVIEQWSGRGGSAALLDVYRRAISVRLFASADTRLGPQGIVRHQLAVGNAVYAFATVLRAAERAKCRDQSGASAASAVCDGVEICFDDDLELDAALVHGMFDDEDRQRAGRVLDVISHLCAVYAAEEVAALFSARPER